MWTPRNNRRQQMKLAMPLQTRWLRTLAIVIALGLPFVLGGFLSGIALAQDRPAAAAASPEARALRQEIEQRYQVLPIHGGVVLTPRQSRRGVQTIEVSGGGVAVNGERVNAKILRDWLGDDAEPVLRLLNLTPDQRRSLFGLAVENELPAATPEAPETPAPEDVLTSDVTVVPPVPEAPGAPPIPEAPEPSVHSGSRVKFGGSITVEKDELAEEAVAIGGSVRVDGEVSRDAVAIGGPVRVNGHVGGNVTSVGGSVHLGPHAVVDGDVASIGGTIDQAKGAQVHGSSSDIGGPFHRGRWEHGWDHDWDFGPFSVFGASMQVFGSLFSLIATVLFTWLCLLLARGLMERVEQRIAAEPWKCAGVGLAGSLSLVPLLVVLAILLAITIIGCIFLLLYPVLAVVLFFVFLFGYAASAYRVGRWSEGRMGRSFGSPYLVALIGVILLQVWSVIGELLDLGPGLLNVFAVMFKLFAFFVGVSATVVGFGGIILTAYGEGPRPLRPATASPPPPPSPSPYTGGDALPLSERSWDEPPPPER
jgi:hypothetical protein